MSMLRKVAQPMESMTKQAFRDEVDINLIVSRARRGQAVTHLARAQPVFIDVSEVGDYKGALDMLRATERFFAGLPSKVRASFGNDAALFLDSVDTVEGRAVLEAAGLIPPIPAAVPVRDAAGRFASDANRNGVADVNPATP